MDPSNLDAWSDNFKGPVQEIISQGLTAFYLTKDGQNLAKTADSSAWQPSNEILELVPNLQRIEVHLITKNTDLNTVNKKLLQQNPVGLVVMGPTIHRDKQPSLIILTTHDTFYVIDPSDLSRGIAFLKRKLADPNIEFWTTNGLREADALYGNYRIDLSQYENVNCCSGVHIHMMKSFKAKKIASLLNYPKMALNQKHFLRGMDFKIERFEDLVEIWLDIDKKDFWFDSSQLSHLSIRPLSVTALNIIKKRCSLVIPLSQSLEENSWREVNMMSNNTFDRLHLCNPQVRQALLRSMKKAKVENGFDIVYFAHLEGGVTSQP